ARLDARVPGRRDQNVVRRGDLREDRCRLLLSAHRDARRGAGPRRQRHGRRPHDDLRPHRTGLLAVRRAANEERRTPNGEPRTKNGEPRTTNGEPRTTNGERLIMSADDEEVTLP